MPFHIRLPLKKMLTQTRTPSSDATADQPRPKHRITALLFKRPLRLARKKAPQEAPSPKRNSNGTALVSAEETTSLDFEATPPTSLCDIESTPEAASTEQTVGSTTPPTQPSAEDQSILAHRSDALLALEGRRDLMSTSEDDLTYCEFLEFARIPGSVYRQIYLEGSRRYTPLAEPTTPDERGISYCPTIASELFSVGSCVPGTLDDLQSIRSSLDPGGSVKSVVFGAGCEFYPARDSPFSKTNGLRATRRESVADSPTPGSPARLRRKPAMMFNKGTRRETNSTCSVSSNSSLGFPRPPITAAPVQVARESCQQTILIDGSSRKRAVEENSPASERVVHPACKTNDRRPKVLSKPSPQQLVRACCPTPITSTDLGLCAGPAAQETCRFIAQSPNRGTQQISANNSPVRIKKRSQPVGLGYVFVDIGNSSAQSRVPTGHTDCSLAQGPAPTLREGLGDENTPRTAARAAAVPSICRRLARSARAYWK